MTYTDDELCTAAWQLQQEGKSGRHGVPQPLCEERIMVNRLKAMLPVRKPMPPIPKPHPMPPMPRPT